MKKSILTKIIMIFILGVIALGSGNVVNAKVLPYSEETYGSKGTVCTTHSNCIVYKNVPAKDGNKTWHIKYDIAGYQGISSTYGLYCLKHDVNNNTAKGRKVMYLMNIKNNKITLTKLNSNGTKDTPIEITGFKHASKMGYILSYSNSYTVPVSKWASINDAEGKGQFASNVQYALWSSMANRSYVDKHNWHTYTREFFEALAGKVSDKTMKDRFNSYGNGAHGDNNLTGIKVTGTPRDINDTATQYMNDYTGYKSIKIPDDSGTPKLINNTIIGPFKVTFQNKSNIFRILSNSEFLLYDKSNNKIDAENWEIGTYSNGTFTKTSKITSDTNFYVKINSDTAKNVGKLVVYGERLSVEAETAIILAESAGAQAQLFVGYASRYWERVGLSIPIDVTLPQANLTITKEDSANANEKIEGIGFTVLNQSTGLYVTSTSGDQGKEPHIFTTDANGKMTISGVVIGDGAKKFKITEVSSSNPYYKADGKSELVDIKSNATVNVTITNPKAYSLTIIKFDSTGKTKLNGAQFLVRYSDNSYVYLKNGKITYSSTTATVATAKKNYAFTVNGELKISGLKRGTYHIYEITAPNNYSLTRQSGYDSTNDWVDCGTVQIGIKSNPNSETYEAAEKTHTIKNKESIRIKIIKTDADTKEPIEGIGFRIFNVTQKKYVISDNGDLGSYQNAKIFWTNENGKIIVNNIPTKSANETFKVIEVSSRNGYYKADTSVSVQQECTNSKTNEFNIPNKKSYSMTLKKTDAKGTKKLSRFRILNKICKRKFSSKWSICLFKKW